MGEESRLLPQMRGAWLATTAASEPI